MLVEVADARMPDKSRVGKPIGGSLEIHVECKDLANMDVFSLSDPFAYLELSETEGEWGEIGKCWIKELQGALGHR